MKQKKGRFLLGMLFIIFLELIVAGTVYYLYNTGKIFTDDGIDSPKSFRKSAIQIEKVKVEKKKEVKIEKDNIKYDIGKEKDGKIDITKTVTSKYEFEKDLLDRYELYQILKSFDEFDTKGHFILNNTQEFIYKYIALKGYNYENMFKYLYQTNLPNKDKIKEQVKSMLNSNILSKYINEGKTPEEIKEILEDVDLGMYASDKFCFNDFCSYKKNKVKEIYEYVENAIFEDKELYKYIKKDSEKYGFDPKLYYSILVVENLRVHTTIKGTFKSFLKKNVPELTVMSKFSFGVFGSKVNFIQRIINRNFEGSIWHIENDFIEHMKNSFFKYNTVKDTWEVSSRSGIKNYILSTKENQVKLLTAYFLQQQKGRKEYIPDFNEQPGVLATLYNMGGFKPPRKDYDVGGALFYFLGNKIYFGELADQVFFSIPLDYLMKRLDDELLSSGKKLRKEQNHIKNSIELLQK